MRLPRQRGMTLLELVVAMGASAIVLALLLDAFLAQQRAFKGGQHVREAQSSVRNALLFLEQKLALAGYGIDPALAFDLTGQPGDTDTTVFYAGPCPTEAAPCVKDRVDGSDELVFYARNPGYWVPPADPPPAPGTTPQGRVWNVVSFNKATGVVTLAARVGDFFPKGRILQGVCAAAAGQKYFTVRTTVPPVATAGNVAVELEPDVLKDPFKRQNAGACDPSRVYQVDRYRFHVKPVPNGDGTYEPFLMLDSGTDADGDGVVNELDEVMVASGIEVMQVAYHFQLHAEGPSPAIPPAGAEPGVPIVVKPGAPNGTVQSSRGTSLVATATPAPSAIARADFRSTALADPSFYDQASLYPYRFGPPLDPERKTNHQGNIRAVRVVLVGRSVGTTDGSTGAPPGPNAPVLNLNVTPAWIATHAAARGGSDGYERIRLETTVAIPSMVSRRLLFD